MILVSDVVNRVNDILNDILSQRWKDKELLALYREAQLAVCARRPDASVVNGSFACAANAKQSLPGTGFRLIDVLANTVTGQPITEIARALLDEQVPTWRKTTATTSVAYYIYNPRDPKNFYLYPTPQVGHNIDIVYAVAPETPAGLGSNMQLDDVYFNPLVDYMLYRAFLIDVENPANQARADARFAAFRVGLGEKLQADAAVSAQNG